MTEYRLSSAGALCNNSSGGKLLKWAIDNKHIKTSTFDNTSLVPAFLYESYAEVIAYRLGHKLGFNMVPYRLCRVIIDNKFDTIACESDSFIGNNEKYISIGKMMTAGVIPALWYGDIHNYRNIINLFSSIKGFKEQIDNTIILDSIILNDDRHFGNFGVIRNNDGTIKSAPIFDNGNSLFFHKHTCGMKYDSSLINYLTCKPFSINFNRQLGLVEGNKISLSSILTYMDKEVHKLIDLGLPYDRGEFALDLICDRLDTVTKLLNT